MTSTALDTSPPSPDVPGNRALFRSPAASPPRTLVDVLAATAARHPDAPALDTGGEVLSYRALCAEARIRALRLTERGIGPGDRVPPAPWRAGRGSARWPRGRCARSASTWRGGGPGSGGALWSTGTNTTAR